MASITGMRRGPPGLRGLYWDVASGDVGPPLVDAGKVAVQKAIRAGVFILFYFVSAQLAGWVLAGLGNPLLSGTLLVLVVWGLLPTDYACASLKGARWPIAGSG